ncbi:SAM-dependent methyltransferase [Glycomyces arizonensis]|uniref:SAM-dependent methyltransferase n=1 Tax=Glycomyces arizonensis TaxID=256035 RepID=UPI00040F9A53|nr:cyclopropane-fatty-acyl-phospholipid synthase family protein [Glycomyces arizonensis]
MNASAQLRVDPERWPDVARAPRSPLRAAAASALLRRVAARLPLRVETPSGAIGPLGPPVLRLHRPEAFLHRLGTSGLIGFGEAYQAGDWDADDLPGLLTALAAGVDSLVPPPLQTLRRPFVGVLPARQDNTRGNARRNIADHYDLSDAMFALFLDETMTYSSALFGTAPARWDDLAEAQRRKIDRLLDRTGVGPDSTVLEIGTGWGEAAVRAAERGARVHTITLSSNQLEHARALAAERGVAARVEVELRDYRDLDPGRRYDAVISVEMIEAVGERYWPAYFATLRRSLAPGGKVGLEAISMRHDRMMAARRTYTWIHKYVFPGGIIPSIPAIERCAEAAGLRIADRLDFGGDYAQTLRLWRERFASRAERLAALGFDEVFRRTWEFYLAYAQAGFASGYLDVHQLILEASG